MSRGWRFIKTEWSILRRLGWENTSSSLFLRRGWDLYVLHVVYLLEVVEDLQVRVYDGGGRRRCLQ